MAATIPLIPANLTNLANLADPANPAILSRKSKPRKVLTDEHRANG